MKIYFPTNECDKSTYTSDNSHENLTRRHNNLTSRYTYLKSGGRNISNTTYTNDEKSSCTLDILAC